MITRPKPDLANPGFDVSAEPAPGAPVVQGEADDPQAQRDLEATLASTYDPAKTHDGKTDDELIAEREHRIETEVDVAIVAGAILAVDAAHHADHPEQDPTPPHHDGDFP